MKYAVISEHQVMNIIDAPEGFVLEGFELVPFEHPCHIGGYYANRKFTAPEPTPAEVPNE